MNRRLQLLVPFILIAASLMIYAAGAGQGRADAAAPAATASPTPPSITYIGRLGAYVRVADACSYYPLTLCDGTVVNVSESTVGQLLAYVGKDVRVDTVTAECGTSIAGRPLYGPVVTSVQSTGPCGTPASPTPAATSASPTPSSSVVYTGRLGAYVQVADGCSYYPLMSCGGTMVQVSESSRSQLQPFVGQYVRVETVSAVCGTGIAGQRLYGPVAIRLQIVGPCGPAIRPEPCPFLNRRVPSAVVQAALAGPDQVLGWGQLCNPAVVPGPSNTRRTKLSLQNIGAKYHPTFNPLVYRCGCP